MYFPRFFKNDSLAHGVASIRELEAGYKTLLEEEGSEQEYIKAQHEKIKLNAPDVWNVYVDGNMERQMEVGFEEFLLNVGEHTKEDLSKITVFRFYTLLNYLKNKKAT